MSSVSRVASTPRNACSARPMRRICAATLRTVSTGTAKPTPTFPWAPLSVVICVFTPITSPRAFKSGPPELPGLIGASVWIALSIARLFGAWSTRPIALTIPDVIERSSPNGLPIATTASPTRTEVERPNRSGVRPRGGVFTFSTARSVVASTPTTLARTASSLEKPTLTTSAPLTTW